MRKVEKSLHTYEMANISSFLQCRNFNTEILLWKEYFTCDLAS